MGKFRTQSFLYLSVTILVSELLSPPLGSILMDTIGSYATFITGFPFLSLGLLPLAFMTEGKPKLDSDDQCHGQQACSSESRTGCLSTEEANHTFTGIFKSTQQNFSSVWKDNALLLGIFSLAVQKLARPMLDLLLQYMSKRYGWKLGKVCTI